MHRINRIILFMKMGRDEARTRARDVEQLALEQHAGEAVAFWHTASPRLQPTHTATFPLNRADPHVV